MCACSCTLWFYLGYGNCYTVQYVNERPHKDKVKADNVCVSAFIRWRLQQFGLHTNHSSTQLTQKRVSPMNKYIMMLHTHVRTHSSTSYSAFSSPCSLTEGTLEPDSATFYSESLLTGKVAINLISKECIGSFCCSSSKGFYLLGNKAINKIRTQSTMHWTRLHSTVYWFSDFSMFIFAVILTVHEFNFNVVTGFSSIHSTITRDIKNRK